jgi:hypothetical protein
VSTSSRASRSASARSARKAPLPVLTSNTSAAAPVASFLDRIEPVISGSEPMVAGEIVRASEEEFRASGLGHDADEDAILDLIVAHPRLLQRPIVELATRARIGRPPEQVLELFE